MTNMKPQVQIMRGFCSSESMFTITIEGAKYGPREVRNIIKHLEIDLAMLLQEYPEATPPTE